MYKHTTNDELQRNHDKNRGQTGLWNKFYDAMASMGHKELIFTSFVTAYVAMYI